MDSQTDGQTNKSYANSPPVSAALSFGAFPSATSFDEKKRSFEIQTKLILHRDISMVKKKNFDLAFKMIKTTASLIEY